MGTESRVALIVGITGSLGSEVGAALLAQGWQVRAQHRNPDKARHTVRSAANIAGLPATRCCSTRWRWRVRLRAHGSSFMP